MGRKLKPFVILKRKNDVKKKRKNIPSEITFKCNLKSNRHKNS